MNVMWGDTEVDIGMWVMVPNHSEIISLPGNKLY